MEKNPPKKSHFFVSVIVLVETPAVALGQYIKALIEILDLQYEHFEIIVINNLGKDIFDPEFLNLLHTKEGIRYRRLSQSSNLDIAESAGLDTAIGDYIVVCSANYDPPSIVPKLVNQCERADCALFGIQRSRKNQSWFWRTGAKWFYRYLRKILKIKFPENITHLKVLRRKDLNIILKIQDAHRHSYLLHTYAGIPWQTYAYSSSQVRPKKLIDQLRFFWRIIVSNSLHPLRIATRMALFLSTINLLYMAYVLFIFLTKDDVIAGWVTSSLQVSGLFFILFIIVAILSEYVGRILSEVQKKPRYYVVEEKNSNLIFNAEARRNVVNQSQL